jgi:hypothetical protein
LVAGAAVGGVPPHAATSAIVPDAEMPFSKRRREILVFNVRVFGFMVPAPFANLQFAAAV